jgi:chorismate dehydratase
MSEPIRVGAVRYLNARPLYHGLDAVANVRLTMAVPSVLARRLSDGLLDVALIPSVEYLRGAAEHGYRILPGFAIAARGAVKSVKLYSRVAFDQIDWLALDEGSRTSQALARVWLDGVHGTRPNRIESFPLGVAVEQSEADAVLLIGDRAMQPVHPSGGFIHEVDLGAAWAAWTGLPFVFALWIARGDAELGGLPRVLEACRDSGMDHARDIANEAASLLALDPDDCYDYLTRVLSYDLGETELAGLRLFARLAAQLGLAPGDTDLVFHDQRDDDTRLQPRPDPANPARRDPAVRR